MCNQQWLSVGDTLVVRDIGNEIVPRSRTSTTLCVECEVREIVDHEKVDCIRELGYISGDLPSISELGDRDWDVETCVLERGLHLKDILGEVVRGTGIVVVQGLFLR